MQKITFKRYVTGFRTSEAEAKGDWTLGEQFEIATGDYVQVLIQEPDASGIDLVVAIAEFDIARDGLDRAVRNTKKFLLNHGASPEDVKLLKKKINAAAEYCGTRVRG